MPQARNIYSNLENPRPEDSFNWFPIITIPLCLVQNNIFFTVQFMGYQLPYINIVVPFGRIMASLFLAFLWISTSSWSILKNSKKNSANIEPSGPRAWSITHIYVLSLLLKVFSWSRWRTSPKKQFLISLQCELYSVDWRS